MCYSPIVAILFWIVPTVMQAQAREGGYARFMEWSLGHPALEVKPVIGRVKFRKHYNAVTFVDTSGRRIKGLNALWGVVCDDTLYLNMDGRHFVPMKEMGAFCYFTGPQYVSPEQSDRLNRNSFLFGLIGGGITAASIDAKNKGLIHYVMNSRTGVVHLMEPPYMRIILADMPELMSRFESEADKASAETMLSYLRKANANLIDSY